MTPSGGQLCPWLLRSSCGLYSLGVSLNRCLMTVWRINVYGKISWYRMAYTRSWILTTICCVTVNLYFKLISFIWCIVIGIKSILWSFIQHKWIMQFLQIFFHIKNLTDTVDFPTDWYKITETNYRSISIE